MKRSRREETMGGALCPWHSDVTLTRKQGSHEGSKCCLAQLMSQQEDYCVARCWTTLWAKHRVCGRLSHPCH